LKQLALDKVMSEITSATNKNALLVNPKKIRARAEKAKVSNSVDGSQAKSNSSKL
jgi:hypothetical protein